MKKLIILLVIVCLWSCNAEDMISRNYSCRFLLDAQLHPTSKIVTAVNSPGYFVWVSFQRINGIVHFYVHPVDNSGDEEVILTTDRENQIEYMLGAYNGIIIGCTNFNGLAAYDQQCPNCLEQTGFPKYPLTGVEKRPMQVECANCKRVYSLETGSSETGGTPLYRYAVAIEGYQIRAYN